MKIMMIQPNYHSGGAEIAGNSGANIVLALPSQYCSVSAENGIVREI